MTTNPTNAPNAAAPAAPRVPHPSGQHSPSPHPQGRTQSAPDRTYLRIRTALMVVVLALGAWSFARVWSPMPVAWLALLVVTVLAAVLVQVLRRAGLVSFVAVLAAITVPVVLMLMVGRSAGRSIRDSFIAPFPELLTTPAPAPATVPLLLPGLVLAWLVGIVVGLAVGTRRARTIGVLASLVGGLVLYLGAQLFTAGQADRHGIIAALMVLTWLADWSLWPRVATADQPQATGRPADHRPAPEPRTERGTGPALRTGALALAFALVASVLTLVPLGEPFQPQDLVQREDDLNSEPNPMPMLAAWAREPDQEVLRRGGDVDTPLHLAVMRDYDGTTFRPPMRPYDPVGGTMTPSPPIAGSQQVVRATVSWPLQTRWLPAPGYPNLVSLPAAQVNADTGTLVVPEVPDAGVLSYSVSSVVSQPDPAQLADASVPDLPEYTEIPQVPEELVNYADELTAEAETPYDTARALEGGIKNNRVFSSEMPGGHSYGRLSTFLLAPEADGGRAGTSEQFASAFAVLARAEGLPTRVVVGFGAGTPMDGQDGTHLVHGKDALAWPEVYFEGQGWVAFNPTPETEDIAPVAQQPPDLEDPGQQQDPPPPEPSEDPDSPPDAEGDPFPWLAILLPVLGVAAGVGLLFLARVLRRRSQYQHGAVGAWQQVLDSLSLAGQRPLPTQSAVEQASQLGAGLSEPAQRIALAAERQAFSGEGAAAAAAADGTFDDAESVNACLRGESSWWRRVLWRISPRPFFRR